MIIRYNLFWTFYRGEEDETWMVKPKGRNIFRIVVPQEGSRAY